MIKKWYKNYGYVIFFAFLIASLIQIKFAMLAIICMVAPIILAAFGKGRSWCGNYCPRGNFFQNVMAHVSPGKKVPKWLRNKAFRGFMVLLIMTNFGIGLSKNWGNLAGIGMVFYRIIVITSIVGIILSLFYSKRTWCTFCPMGTIAAVITKIRGRNVTMTVSESCVSCGLCTKNCPMGISPKDWKGAALTDPDCILCGECGKVCPKEAVQKS